jgi:hypothetical protein
MDSVWGGLGQMSRYHVLQHDGGGVAEEQSILTPPTIKATGGTSFSVSINTSNMDPVPTKYRVSYTNKANNVTTTMSPDPTTNQFNITGLAEGGTYDIEIVPYFGATTGGRYTVYGQSLLTSYAGNGILGTAKNPTVITQNEKSGYLTLSIPKDSKRFAFASRAFSSIVVPTSIQLPIGGARNQSAQFDYYTTASYNSFGTSLFLDSKYESPSQGGGIGFFADEKGNDGYYLLINTIPSAISSGAKSVRIVKVSGTERKVLADSQQDASSTLDQIVGGSIYNIDIKVKIHQFTVSITAYINGFKITATDTTSYVNGKANVMLPITNRVALVCTAGTTNYDYVYGKKIEEKDYLNAQNNLNFYQGQFENDFLSTSYGDLSYFDKSQEDAVAKESIDEFGTVAREIRKIDGKYNQAPAFPLRWSTGLLKNASIISSSSNPFKGEAYVLNNSSAVVPLANDVVTFGIYGSTLSKSGSLEYSTGDEGDYKTKEPVSIQTRWLQTAGDVQALALWIKDRVINRGKVVSMTVFGNPLIEVNDIVNITYSYQGFQGTERLIVTSVNHRFDGGLETDIVCRTL